jgi:hypothetical protein
MNGFEMLHGIILKGTAQKSIRNENPSSLEYKSEIAYLTFADFWIKDLTKMIILSESNLIWIY